MPPYRLKSTNVIVVVQKPILRRGIDRLQERRVLVQKRRERGLRKTLARRSGGQQFPPSSNGIFPHSTIVTAQFPQIVASTFSDQHPLLHGSLSCSSDRQGHRYDAYAYRGAMEERDQSMLQTFWASFGLSDMPPGRERSKISKESNRIIAVDLESSKRYGNQAWNPLLTGIQRSFLSVRFVRFITLVAFSLSDLLPCDQFYRLTAWKELVRRLPVDHCLPSNLKRSRAARCRSSPTNHKDSTE